MTGIQLYRTRTKFFKRYTREFKSTLKSLINPVIEYLQYQSYENLVQNIPVLVTDQSIKETYVKLYADVGTTFGQNINKFIKKSIEDDIWAQMMENWCLTECAGRITEVTAYSRELIIDFIQKNIQKGTAEGLSIRQISDAIMEDLPREYNKTAAYRSKRIAQTEVISASNMAGLKAAEQTGLTMVKKWSTRPYGFAQSLQNERHALLADLPEQRPKLNEPFIVDGEELMYPGDPAGSAGNIINCHCVLTYEVL